MRRHIDRQEHTDLREPRVELALAEHTRLCREIAELERAAAGQKQLLAALRMCRAHIEGELRRRGYALVDGLWTES